MIRWLQNMQVKEIIRDDIGLSEHLVKADTPTMGGVIIIFATVIPALLWMNIYSIYTWLIIFVVLVLGAVGFIDRSEEHTSELQSRGHLVCRLLLEKKKAQYKTR